MRFPFFTSKLTWRLQCCWFPVHLLCLLFVIRPTWLNALPPTKMSLPVSWIRLLPCVSLTSNLFWSVRTVLGDPGVRRRRQTVHAGDDEEGAGDETQQQGRLLRVSAVLQHCSHYQVPNWRDQHQQWVSQQCYVSLCYVRYLNVLVYIGKYCEGIQSKWNASRILTQKRE